MRALGALGGFGSIPERAAARPLKLRESDLE